MSFRTVFDTPAYMDEPEPSGEKWELEAFDDFCDRYKTEIEFWLRLNKVQKNLLKTNHLLRINGQH